MLTDTTKGLVIDEAKKIALRYPPMKDLSASNITVNVHAVNSLASNPRIRYLMENLVDHLHDFTRKTKLTTEEWMATIEYLTSVGHACTDLRQEFILLSDILGLSVLVDTLDHPKPPNATEGTVLGPFHAHDAQATHLGSKISKDENGKPCLVACTIKDTKGKPVDGVQVDVWETDSKGFYDVQYADRVSPDGRAIVTTNADGEFYFQAIIPVPYPIPFDGPVGKLLKILGRHPYRPSHMHFLFEKEGYDRLITTLYLRGDPFESSDAVFAVKDSLVIELGTVSKEQATKYNSKEGNALISYDFVLGTEVEIAALKKE